MFRWDYLICSDQNKMNKTGTYQLYHTNHMPTDLVDKVPAHFVYIKYLLQKRERDAWQNCDH